MRKTFTYIFKNYEEIILVPAMALMLIINFANVLARYVLKVSWAASEELSVILFAYVALMGAATAVKRKQHLGFTLILDNLPPLMKLIVNGLISISAIVLMSLMLYFGIKVCGNQVKFNAATPAMRIPMVYASASVPLSAIAIGIRVIQDYVMEIKNFSQRGDERW